MSYFGLKKAYQLAAESYALAIAALDKATDAAIGPTKDLVAITDYVYSRVN